MNKNSKDFNIFSADELAMLKEFAKNGLEEDKRLHGIIGTSNKDKNINKTKNLTSNFYKQEKSKTVSINNTNTSNQFSMKKEEKKPPPNPYVTKPITKNE